MYYKQRVIATMAFSCLSVISNAQAESNSGIQNTENDSLVKEALKGHPEVVFQTNKSKANPDVAGAAHFTTAYPEGRVIVRLKAGTDPKTLSSNLGKAGNSVTTLKNFPLAEAGKPSAAGSRSLLVLQSSTLNTKQFIALLKQNPSVEVAEPDYFVYASSTTPNDSRFSELWDMNNTGQTGGTVDADIDAPEAWDRLTGNGSVTVGNIDTGVDYHHPDLAANIWHNLREANGSTGVDDDSNGYVDDIYGIDALNGDSDPMDDNAHGTHTSGTLGGVGNNGEGVTGVAWNVKIASCKFLSAGGSGYTSGAIECVNYFTWLKLHGENIVATNNSWGGGGFEQILKDVIDASGTAGTLFVAAAGNDYGNDNDSNPSYPASYDSANIISVAATNHSDNLAYFSNYGPTSVDLAAPGEGILSSVISLQGCDFSPENATLFHDGFESGLAGWSLYSSPFGYVFNDPAYWWTQDSSNHYTGSYSTSDSAGDYVNNSISSAVAAPDLSSAGAGQLCGGLWVKGTAENGYDYFSVYISNDSGLTWTSVLSTTGAYADWTKLTFQIPDAYKNSSFRIGLLRTNDSDIAYDGYYFDDVGISAGEAGSYIGQYASYNGTSMATPHVTGGVALAAMAFPGDSVAQRKARILDNVDPLASLSGLVATGGRLNLSNVVSGGTDNLLRWPDFNTDAKGDILWRHYSSGVNSAWFMDGTTDVGGASIATVSDVNWRIVGTPDMNYDGKPDILWRHYSSGSNYVWYMNGTASIGGASVATVSDANWHIVGTPDMNGDGKPDILWRHYSSGSNYVWYMNGSTGVGGASLPIISDVAWHIVNNGDF
ncbi:MAG: hypothetical protein EPN89_13730 [Methylovulum sp.]|nr:MAG: hypothetical protein EPN89_13730 [Methylovulum sp.]